MHSHAMVRRTQQSWATILLPEEFIEMSFWRFPNTAPKVDNDIYRHSYDRMNYELVIIVS